ncbi:MAG TPA: Uma2 family endonuclease [Rhodocyclaceae bacterium]|nr:Uma2 family endonuclease [Rhodocyclaceae bacterium]
MGFAQRSAVVHTYADYITWPADARYELIDGVAYAMSPAPTRRHQRIVGQVFRQIANALDGARCEAYIAPFDVRLPQGDASDAAIDTVVQPDISIICDPDKLDERGCCGAPDWIIEVLSPGTVGHDQIVKKALYERVGVREYWTVHPIDNIVTVYVLENGSYGKPTLQELIGTTSSAVLPGVAVDWQCV